MSKVKVKLTKDEIKNFVHQVNVKGIDYSSSKNGDDFTFTIEANSIGSLINTMCEDQNTSQANLEKEKGKVITLDEELNANKTELKELKADLETKISEIEALKKMGAECPIDKLETAKSEPEVVEKSNFFQGFVVGGITLFGLLMIV